MHSEECGATGYTGTSTGNYVVPGSPRTFFSSDSLPFLEMDYENSPYDRVSRLYGEGANWRSHGLDLYDYGARWHDAALGRWLSVDPLTEKYYHISPYVYCADNPVNAIVPDGRKVVDTKGRNVFYLNSKGKVPLRYKFCIF